MSDQEFDLHRFFEMSLDLMCLAGFDGRFKRINSAWERTLGYSAVELLSRPYVDFVHPDDLARTLEEAGKLNSGTDTNSFENRYRCKDGAYRWLFWTAKPDFKSGLIFSVARDITDQKFAEEELRKAKAELERSNHDLAEYAYIVSHDLKEPLRSIAGHLQLLENRAVDLDVKSLQYLQYALSGAKRMRELIDALLSYAKVSTETRPFTKVDLNMVACKVIENLRVAIAETGATVECGPLPVVLGSETQLCQVLQNLIENALKFRSAGRPEVHVSAKRNGGEWIVAVRDNGIGFDPALRERIFVVFQRLHLPEEFEGTGIGLAVCKKIVERHGGHMDVVTEPGKGSEFSFSLPAMEGQSAGTREIPRMESAEISLP